MNAEKETEGGKKLASVQNVNYVFFFLIPFHNLFDVLNSGQKSYYNYKTYSLG